MPRSSSTCIVLMCQKCGERTVLAGPESVWHSGYTFFECECGKSLTLADRLVEQDTMTPLASSYGHLGRNR